MAASSECFNGFLQQVFPKPKSVLMAASSECFNGFLQQVFLLARLVKFIKSILWLGQNNLHGKLGRLHESICRRLILKKRFDSVNHRCDLFDASYLRTPSVLVASPRVPRISTYHSVVFT